MNNSVSPSENTLKNFDNILLNPDAAKMFGESLDTAAPAETFDWLSVARQCVVPQGIDMPPPISLFDVAGVPVMTLGEMSLMIAKPKQGKTTVASWIVSMLITKGYRVTIVDTEQGLYYSSRSQAWTLRSAGLTHSELLTYLDLKKYSPSERMLIMEAYLAAEGSNIDMIVLDGVRDLFLDPNKSDDYMPIVNALMRWTIDYNLHVMNILHKNKVDANARGGIGTELQNKCETTLDVELEGAQIVVSPLYTRNESFAPFALVRDTYGTPHLTEGYTAPMSASQKKAALKWHEVTETQHHRLCIDAFKEGNLKPSELKLRLTTIYSKHFDLEIGRPKIETLIDYLHNEINMIGRQGGARDPRSYYFLTTQQVTQQVNLVDDELLSEH